MRQRFLLVMLLLAVFLIGSCGSNLPLDRLKERLAQYDEYTVILNDMNTDGLFFKDYYHQYKVVYAMDDMPDSLQYSSYISDWFEVPEKEYAKYQNMLGMVVLAKTPDGDIKEGTPYPPGYRYVGNSNYGRWRTDHTGRSFWEFYGQYALLSQLLGAYNRPIYRNDWDTFTTYSRRGQPYFGPNKEYGTYGSYTKTTNKSFFERKRQQQISKQSSFSNKVKSKVRRSNMSGVRSRSGRSGK